MDWTILNWIHNTFTSPFMDFIVPKITSLGNGGFIWIVIGVCLLTTRKYRKIGIFVLVGLLAGLIIGNGIVKNVVARPRPCWINPEVTLLIPCPTDFSFPSGHTQSSVIASTILTIANKKWGYAVIPLAVLISLSRLYLYVHFPSDVLAGAIMGVTIGSVTFVVGEKIKNRFKVNFKGDTL